jgi:hypothetical protein
MRERLDGWPNDSFDLAKKYIGAVINPSPDGFECALWSCFLPSFETFDTVRDLRRLHLTGI